MPGLQGVRRASRPKAAASPATHASVVSQNEPTLFQSMPGLRIEGSGGGLVAKAPSRGKGNAPGRAGRRRGRGGPGGLGGRAFLAGVLWSAAVPAALDDFRATARKRT